MEGKRFAFRSIHQTMHWLIIVLVGVLMYPASALAQRDTNPSTWEMEDIIVIGDRSLISLQMEIYQAEDLKFEILTVRMNSIHCSAA